MTTDDDATIVGKTPLFIGLAGTLNAGKDSLGEALARDYGFMHVSTGDMIRLMKKREFGEDSPQALLLRNDPYINNLRAEKGPGFLIEAIYEDWERQKDTYPGGFVASGMRAIGEAEAIQKLKGIIVFVDADPKVRYARAIARSRDANDKGRTFEEFIAQEQSEINVDPDDKNVQNLPAMKRMADIVIENDTTTIEDFQAQAISAIQKFVKKAGSSND